MSDFIFEPIPTAAQQPAPAQAPAVISVQERRAQLQTQMRQKIDLLPQRDQLEESDIQQWVGYVSSVMPDQAFFHVTRLNGVGGSEIGALVRNYLGDRATFSSAHDWALQKLMRRYPDPPNAVMKRGIENEAYHRQRFHNEYRCARDVKQFERLSSAKGQLSWMRYSPDDLVQFNEQVSIPMLEGTTVILPGQRYLVDYKSPTSVDDQDLVSFEYVCQLNMGAILAQEQGIELAGTMLSQFDWSNWRLKNDYIAVDPKLAELIKEAGQHYWDGVLNGRVPDYVYKRTYELNPQAVSDNQALAEKVAKLAALSKAAKEQSDTLRATLMANLGLTDTRLSGAKIAFPNTLTISSATSIDKTKVIEDLRDKPELLNQCRPSKKSSKPNYNLEAIVQYLKDQNVDLGQFETIDLDPQRTHQALVEAKLDADEYLTETVRFLTNKKVTEATKNWVQGHFAHDAPAPDDSEQADQAQQTETQPAIRPSE